MAIRINKKVRKFSDNILVRTAAVLLLIIILSLGVYVASDLLRVKQETMPTISLFIH